jgi:hypothetical protein
MVHLSRSRLAQLALAILTIGVAVAAVTGVSKLTYPTVATSADDNGDPSTVTPIAGTGTARITLTADGAAHIGLTTAKVTAAAPGKPALTIPYAAVFYDPQGATWAYVATEPLVFVRQAITVDSIAGDVATLSAGPPVATEVVTLGAAELYGIEVGVGEE